MNVSSRPRTGLFILAAVALSVLPAHAKTNVDYYELSATGSAKEISSAFNKDTRLKTEVFGDNRETFLMLALREDRPLDVITAILEAGGSPTAKAKDKRTPVMYAAQYSSDPEVVKKIVSYGTFLGIGKGGRVKAKDASGHTSFHYAKLNGNPAIYQTLLSYAKDPEAAPAAQKQEAAPGETAQSPRGGIGMATATYVPVPEGEDVPEAGAAAEETDEAPPEAAQDEGTPADPAAAAALPSEQTVPEAPAAEAPAPAEIPEAEAEVVEVAAPQEEAEAPGGAEVPEDTQETGGTEKAPAPADGAPSATPSPYLYDYAVTQSMPAPQEGPLPAAVRVDEPDRSDANGVTLLMKAAKAGNDWDVRTLIESGADVNLRDQDGWSALMYAVRYQNSLGIVQELIQGGAHIRVRNKYNATPLLLAADCSQNPAILSLLLENRSATEDEVYAAFVMAITSTAGSDHIKQAKVRLFLDKGVSVNRVWKGRTPLMYAAEYCDSTAVLRMLLDAGARTTSRDAEGKTAFDYAKENRRLNHDDIYWTLNEGVGY